MITWIQLRTQKHIKLISAALLVVIVIPFVFTIGNQSFFGSHDDGRLKSKDFYGYNLASEGTSNYLKQMAQISSLLSREQMMGPNHMYDTERYSKERAAALTMARMLGVAEPTEAELRAYIRQKPMFQDDKGKFSATGYKNMIDYFAANQGIPESTLLRILSEDYRIEKVRTLLGGAGFVNQNFIALERQNAATQWTIHVGKISLASFNPAIDPDEATLKNFYETNKSRFEISERLRLTQYRFPAVSFVASVKLPTDDEVNGYYERNKFRYATAKTDANAPLDAATKNRVVQDIIQAGAVQLAAQKADEFALALWRESTTFDSPGIATLAKSMGAQITLVEPFARGSAPKVADASAEDVEGMWTLTTSERFFSDVVTGSEGASVFAFSGTIPSRMPSFAEVKSQVKDAYVAEQRNLKFVAYGKDLQKKIQADVLSGKSFDAICTSYGLSEESFANLKIETADRTLLRDGGPLDVASRLSVGGVSAMQIDEKGGSFIYLQKKIVPPFETVQAKPEEVASLRKHFATIDGWEVLGALCDKREAELQAELEASSKKK